MELIYKYVFNESINPENLEKNRQANHIGRVRIKMRKHCLTEVR